MLLLTLGGAFLFTPQSRAQSEVAPDHFDGTDSWAAAAVTKAPAPRQKSNSVAAVSAAKTSKPAKAQFHPVAARQVIAPSHATAASKKRKPAAPKSTN